MTEYYDGGSERMNGADIKYEVRRTEVDGGWLYITLSSVGTSTAFVPNPDPLSDVKSVRNDMLEWMKGNGFDGAADAFERWHPCSDE